MRVGSLGWEEMATHFGILGWKIPGTEVPGRLYCPWGHKGSGATKRARLAM